MQELVESLGKVSSVRRSVLIIDTLARKGPLGLRPLATETGLPAASALRILMDLAEERIVEQHNSLWDLSYRLMEIGGLQRDRVDIVRLARPFCSRIAAETGETVNIVLRNGDGAVCIDKVRGDTRMQLDWRVGMKGPLHCGGSAKAILAFMPEEDQGRVLSAPMPALTEFTITDPQALRTELGRIRRRGYSIDDQEVVLGIWCCAVPILDQDGFAIAAISVTGPSPKRPGDSVVPLRDRLNEPCSAISRRLGFGGAWIS